MSASTLLVILVVGQSQCRPQGRSQCPSRLGQRANPQ